MIKIEITIPDGVNVFEKLEEHMAALGFACVGSGYDSKPDETPDAEVIADFKAAAAAQDLTDDELASAATPPAPEPAPAKRTRRSKEQIEADKAAEALRVLEEAAKAEAKIEQPQISTNPEDRKQDDADEAQESGAEISVESVRGLAGQYVERFGLAAANEDGHDIFTKALGPVPDGMVDSKGVIVTKWRFSVIPTDEESLRKIVPAWVDALKNNPYEREQVS